MHQLDQLKNFNVDGLDMEELVALSLLGRQIRAEYEALQIEEPAWVDVQIKALRREIHVRNANALESRRREIDLRLDSLKTPGQKKQELLNERAQIDKALKAVGA
jgi:hypothetical protein